MRAPKEPGRPTRPTTSATSSPITRPVDIRPGPLTTESVLTLQKQAGNTAVTRLVKQARKPQRSRVAQRAPLTAAQDPEGYTAAGGKADVKSTGTTRVEVHDLKFGVKGGFADSYTSPRSGEHPSAEKSMTEESPDNMAVVVMPDKLDDRPVQVIVHFAGFGFRGGTDPYAGYLVASGDKAGYPGSAKGTTRDVDQEHWEQQIGEINKTRSGPQVVAILAQGRGMSDFGNPPTYAYIDDVLSKVPTLSGLTSYSIIESAHSGGGYQLGRNLDRDDQLTADRSKLTKPKDPKLATPQPADLVVMYDAEAITTVMPYLSAQIDSLITVLKTASADDGLAAIKAATKFRGYYAVGGGYEDAYVAQNGMLQRKLTAVPAQWRDDDPADPTAIRVHDLYRFIPVAGVKHEHVISGPVGNAANTGSVANALRASVDPTSDRAEGLDHPKPKAAPKAAAPKTAPKAKTPAAVQPTVQRDDAKKVPPTPVPKPAWKPSSATSEVAVTADDKAALAGQTPAEREADRVAFDRTAQRRLTTLEKSEKKGTLKSGEDAELAGLRTLSARTQIAQRALKRLDVEEVLASTTPPTTVAAWFGDIEKGAFLGMPLRVHKALAERLTRAENALLGDAKVNPSGLDAAALGGVLNMKPSTSDLRAPALAVGGSTLSMHTFGLAVDLNASFNPFLGNQAKSAPEVVKRATSLVQNAAVDYTPAFSDPSAAYSMLSNASAALKTYFSFRGAAGLPALQAAFDHHTAAPGEPTDVKKWQARIEKDYAAIAPDFNEEKNPPEAGFIDLDQAVVAALTGAGLTWGGTYSGAKDIMHFDLREGDGEKINKARAGHTGNT